MGGREIMTQSQLEGKGWQKGRTEVLRPWRKGRSMMWVWGDGGGKAGCGCWRGCVGVPRLYALSMRPRRGFCAPSSPPTSQWNSVVSLNSIFLPSVFPFFCSPLLVSPLSSYLNFLLYVVLPLLNSSASFILSVEFIIPLFFLFFFYIYWSPFSFLYALNIFSIVPSLI